MTAEHPRRPSRSKPCRFCTAPARRWVHDVRPWPRSEPACPTLFIQDRRHGALRKCRSRAGPDWQARAISDGPNESPFRGLRGAIFRLPTCEAWQRANEERSAHRELLARRRLHSINPSQNVGTSSSAYSARSSGSTSLKSSGSRSEDSSMSRDSSPVRNATSASSRRTRRARSLAARATEDR